MNFISYQISTMSTGYLSILLFHYSLTNVLETSCLLIIIYSEAKLMFKLLLFFKLHSSLRLDGKVEYLQALFENEE